MTDTAAERGMEREALLEALFDDARHIMHHDMSEGTEVWEYESAELKKRFKKTLAKFGRLSASLARSEAGETQTWNAAVETIARDIGQWGRCMHLAKKSEPLTTNDIETRVLSHRR